MDLLWDNWAGKIPVRNLIAVFSRFQFIKNAAYPDEKKNKGNKKKEADNYFPINVIREIFPEYQVISHHHDNTGHDPACHKKRNYLPVERELR